MLLLIHVQMIIHALKVPAYGGTSVQKLHGSAIKEKPGPWCSLQ